MVKEKVIVLPFRVQKTKIFDIVNIFLLLFLVIVTLYPIYYVLIASISVPVDFVRHQGLLLVPQGLSTISYDVVLQNPNITIGYQNTLIVVFAATTLSIFLTSFGAYFLSQKSIMLQKPLTLFFVFTMFFNGGIIPFYLTVMRLKLNTSLLCLIFPVAINTFNMIIMRTAFLAVPDSMEESAKLDGAGHFTILFRIFIPLCLPTVVVIILFYAVQNWNAWFNASIFLRDRKLYPLQLVMREILIQNDTNSMTAMVGSNDQGDTRMVSETIKYSVIVVASAPILLLYPFLQKYFVKGIMVGAVKG